VHLFIEVVNLIELPLQSLHLFIGFELLLFDLLSKLTVLISQLFVKLHELVEVIVLTILQLSNHLLQRPLENVRLILRLLHYFLLLYDHLFVGLLLYNLGINHVLAEFDETRLKFSQLVYEDAL
jgi:hypothetical protein